METTQKLERIVTALKEAGYNEAHLGKGLQTGTVLVFNYQKYDSGLRLELANINGNEVVIGKLTQIHYRGANIKQQRTHNDVMKVLCSAGFECQFIYRGYSEKNGGNVVPFRDGDIKISEFTLSQYIR